MPVDYGVDMGGGAPSGGIFGPLMLFRKALSICAMVAVAILEAAVGIQFVPFIRSGIWCLICIRRAETCR